MSCNIDLEYLEKLAKMMCHESPFMVPAGRSFSKIALIEAQCVSRIESLLKEAEIIGISRQDINNLYRQTQTYYRENCTQTDFLHTYEAHLRDTIRRFKYNLKESTMSIADLIKVEDTITKRNYYLSRDWVGVNKLIRKRK